MVVGQLLKYNLSLENERNHKDQLVIHDIPVPTIFQCTSVAFKTISRLFNMVYKVLHDRASVFLPTSSVPILHLLSCSGQNPRRHPYTVSFP